MQHKALGQFYQSLERGVLQYFCCVKGKEQIFPCLKGTSLF